MAALTEQNGVQTAPNTTQSASLAPAKKPLPMVPTNLEEAWRVSEALARSSLVPSHYQGHPENVLAAFYMAADLGISGMQAMREIYVVKGVPRASAALKVALVKQSPECLLWECVESTREKATFRTHRRGDPKPTVLTFTLEQAKQAGLYPGKEDSGWAKWPENMLRARASSFLADIVYPDVVKGLRTSEEMEDVDEREVPGTRIFEQASAPPLPPPATARAEAERRAETIVRAEHERAPVAVQAQPEPQKAAEPEAAREVQPPAGGAPDPLDVVFAELEQVDSMAAIDELAKRGATLCPKGHPRRNDLGAAVNAAKRRVHG